MQDGWFMVLMLLGGLAFAGTLIFFWLGRALAHQRAEESLSQQDLRLLEESARALIERLRDAADEAVAAIDRRQAELQALLDEVDARLEDNPRAAVREEAPEADTRARRDICRLAGEGLGGDEIARRSGLTRGEVELILELNAARE